MSCGQLVLFLSITEYVYQEVYPPTYYITVGNNTEYKR
jgi:hypothetical protein